MSNWGLGGGQSPREGGFDLPLPSGSVLADGGGGGGKRRIEG